MRSEEGTRDVPRLATAGVTVLLALGLILALTRPEVPAQPAASAPSGTTPRNAVEAAGDQENVPESCPITIAGDNVFIPAAETPEGPPTVHDVVWYGTPQLWTMLNPEGEVWRDLPVAADGSLTEKTFWWSANYSAENPGRITFTAEHLDGSARTVEARKPMGSGFNPFMMAPTHESVTVVGAHLSEPGCWELTAEYRGATLSYVVWVAS